VQIRGETIGENQKNSKKNYYPSGTCGMYRCEHIAHPLLFINSKEIYDKDTPF
jgi:hypothetical protein